MDKYTLNIFIVVGFLAFIQVTAKKCGGFTTFQEDSKLITSQEEFYCPGPEDPNNHTECCLNPKFVCCPESAIVYKINNRLVRIVGMTVITSCICLSGIILICCFWNSCPLYNTCREDFILTDVVAYAKDDDSLDSIQLPGEKGRKHNYDMKIKPVEEV